MTTISTQFDTYQDAAAHVAEHAPNAYELPLITSHCDADLHTVWLDKTTNTVWHAFTEPDSDGWALDSEPARDAQSWIEDQLTLVLDRLADPEGDSYVNAGPDTSADDDLDTLAEFEEVQLAALYSLTGNTDPVIVDRMIRGKIGNLSAEIARLSRLRGVNLTTAYGTEHGAAARAARALDISHSAASRAMSAPDDYASRVRAGFEKARELNS